MELKHKNCEFCVELYDFKNSRFKEIYGKHINSRIIYKNDLFFVIPTIGQLFPSSLLIIPFSHHETIADLPQNHRSNLIPLIEQITRKLKIFGYPLLFEHGAKCCSDIGCGIFHAHLHVVPVPHQVSWEDLIPFPPTSSNSLKNAWDNLKNVGSYILLKDTNNNINFLRTEYFEEGLFESQFIRQALVNYFQIDKPWNWREYNMPEESLIETIDFFQDINFK